MAWWNPADIPRIASVGLDISVLVFTAVVALLTSVLFSLAPALRALRIDLTESLKDGGQSVSSGGARQRFRNALVVVQMALAVLLLVGAGLMLRSLWSLQAVPIGFDPTNVLTMRVALPQASYASPEQVVGFYERLVDRVRTLPGVRTAGAARLLPLGSTIGDFGLMVDGYVPPPGTNAKGDWQIVTDGYVEAMGERVVRGRTITAADTVGQSIDRARQRGAGARLLRRPRSRSAAASRSAATRNARGSPSSASSPTSATTGSPKSSRRSSTFRTGSGTSAVGNPIRSMALVVKTDDGSADSGRRRSVRRFAASTRICRSPTSRR